MPYLGKNDHPAAISSPKLVEVTAADQPSFIDSLHRTDHIRYDAEGEIKTGQNQSFFKEFMPIGLNEANNGYVFQPLVFTNHEIDPDSISEDDRRNMYCDGDRVLYFL